jgi:myo-inositol catabolism protein IolC
MLLGGKTIQEVREDSMSGYDGRLFLMAFDHRSSFTRDLFGLSAAPTSEEAARISEAKGIIFDGFLQALAAGAPREAAGVLVDETFGSEVARRARADGALLAMPVEASGRKEFDFEYGEAFGEHIERFDPTFAKVLVRYNPDDPDGNATQTERLKRLSDWLHARDRLFLFELLVPATPAQSAALGGDTDRYDRELRPKLMVRAMAELQGAGVEPDIWKIEGLETREDCERVVEQARAGGRSRVACVVLGRGASQSKVEHWLRTAAPVTGFNGFAVGRTIWMDSLVAYRDGAVSREAAADRIASTYLRVIEVYMTAAP